MNVLVTGGAGFLGSKVVRTLEDNGHAVRVLDIVEQQGPLRGERYVGSILDPNAVCRAAQGMDSVIHLAAMLGVRKTEENRLGCMEVNVQGTVNLLEACIKERVQHVLFASSSEVYGDPVTVPIMESGPIQPRSVYAISKLAGEEYVRSYAKRYGLTFSIARLFNCYGEGQVAEFVVPRFVRACQTGSGPVVYGDGSQVRSFSHVDDTSQGLVTVLESLENRPEKVAGETFNIGNADQPISMLALAELILKIAAKHVPDKELSIQMVPFSESDRESGREITNRIPDVSKIRDLLGFIPGVDLETGLDNLFSAEIPESWWEPLSGNAKKSPDSSAAHRDDERAVS